MIDRTFRSRLRCRSKENEIELSRFELRKPERVRNSIVARTFIKGNLICIIYRIQDLKQYISFDVR